MIAELNDRNDVTKAYELATSLKRDAQTVLSDRSPNMHRNYLQLVNILGSRFEPRNQSKLCRAKIMKERVSKLTYPTLQHCLRMLYTTNGKFKQ